MALRNQARREAFERAASKGSAVRDSAFGTPRSVTIRSKRFSKVQGFCILLCVLALAVGAYIAIPHVFVEEEGEQTQELLLGIGADEVTAVTWVYDGVETSVELSGETWVLAGSDASLDQESVESIVEAAVSATVERSLPSDSETEGMGLDSPVVEASITLSDGSTLSFSIGSEDDSGDEVYVETSVSDGISMVDNSLLMTFSTDSTHLYEMEDVPNASYVDALSVQYGEKTLVLTHCEGGSDASYTDEYEWFVGQGSDMKAADEDAATLAVSAVNNLIWESCEDPECEDLSSYGLDSPVLIAEIDYTTESSVQTGETDEDGNPVYETQEEQGSFVLEVGDMASDGTYYAHPQGSSAVYTVSSEDVQTLMEAVEDEDYFQTDDVCLMDWDTVDSIEVSYGGATKTIEFVREGQDGEGSEEESSDGSGSDESSDESSEATYLVDGEEADSSDVEAILDGLDEMVAEGEAEESNQDDEFEMSFTFKRNAQTYTEMTLGFIRYDNNFYLVSFDGEKRLLVNRNDVIDLEGLFEAL